jgi:hypothetical protein
VQPVASEHAGALFSPTKLLQGDFVFALRQRSCRQTGSEHSPLGSLQLKPPLWQSQDLE